MRSHNVGFGISELAAAVPARCIKRTGTWFRPDTIVKAENLAPTLIDAGFWLFAAVLRQRRIVRASLLAAAIKSSSLRQGGSSRRFGE
jgi:hypothetical protein